MLSALDSGCGNYGINLKLKKDTLWLTSSLRGLIEGDLTVKVLNEGVHSGDGSGVIPSAHLILR